MMEVLSDEIDAGKSITLFKEYKTRIFDTAKNIKSNDATFNTSTLPQVRDKLVSLMANYTDSIRSVDACEKAFLQMKHEINPKQEVELETFKELFMTSMRAYQRDSTLEDIVISDLESLIMPPIPRDEEVLVEAPAERTWPKDPITKTNIKKAVRNKTCKHIYDRASIEGYIDQRKANNQRVPCPVAGCRNKNTDKKDLVPDDETNLLIESLKDQKN